MARLLINNNNIGGEFPSYFGTTVRPGWYRVRGNRFTGRLPDSLMNQTGFTYFQFSNNYFDRDSKHDIILSPAQQTRYDNLIGGTKTIVSQSDVEAPLLTGLIQVRSATGPTSVFTVAVDENSYAIAGDLSAVAASGQGMPVVFTGAGACANITSNAVTINTGTATLYLTLPSIGVYNDCQVAIQDHAGNYSNRLYLDTVRNDPYRVCGHPSLTIPQAECTALVDLYQSTLGSGRTNKTNRLTHSDPEQWYGITLSGGRTRRVDLNGNNLLGTVPGSLGVLTGLNRVRLYQNTTLSGTIAIFSGMTDLVYLQLFSSQFSGDLANLIPLTKLQTVDLEFTRVHGDLSALSGMNNLQQLYLQIAYQPGVQGDLKNFAHMVNLNTFVVNTANKPATGWTNYSYVYGDLAHLSGMAQPIAINTE